MIDTEDFVYDISGTLVEQILNGEIDVDFSGGNGTYQEPYEISSVEELAYLAAQVYQGYSAPNMHYIQTQDIYISRNIKWAPIGTYDHPFFGYYDGNGKTFQFPSLSINATFAGIFGVVGYSAIVENVTLLVPQISCGQEIDGAIGTLAGLVDFSALVRNCKVTGMEGSAASFKIVDAGSGFKWTGGLVGCCMDGAIENCSVEGLFNLVPQGTPFAISTLAVFGSQGSTGGIVGQMENGRISNCKCEAAVCGNNGDGPGYAVGGIVGRGLGGIIDNCFVQSVVSCMAGDAFMSAFDLESSISGAENAGGICGDFDGDFNMSDCHVRVQGIAATRRDDPYAAFAGGLVGMCDDVQIQSCTVDGFSAKNKSAEINIVKTCTISGDTVGGFVGYANAYEVELTGSQVYKNTTLHGSGNHGSCAFVGELQADRGGVIEGCSFEGSGATRIFYGYFEPGLADCYMTLSTAYGNLFIYTQNGDNPDPWAHYWAIMPGLFDDKVVSTSFSWIAQWYRGSDEEIVEKLEKMAADLGLQCAGFPIPPDGSIF